MYCELMFVNVDMRANPQYIIHDISDIKCNEHYWHPCKIICLEMEAHINNQN